MYIAKMDAIELTNALTMLPFVILTFLANNVYLSISITCMWVFAFTYHTLIAFNNPFGWIFYLLDCILQVLTLVTVISTSPCYPRKIKYIAHGLGCLIVLNVLSYAMDGILKNRYNILWCVVVSHGLHVVIGYFYACSRLWYNIMFSVMCSILAMLYFCENGCPYIWPYAHVLIAVYIYCFWKALKLTKI